MTISEIIGRMSLEEKIRLCSGADFWHSKAAPAYGVPAFKMSDGPHGLRCQEEGGDMIGINDSLPATCFPAAVTAGAAWDVELYAAEGRAIGLEAAAAGVQLVLGPGCNIKRSPLCGRNFEYLSEDPYLAGKLAAAYIRGQQGTGVGSCLKHFAANNQEYKRQNGDSQIDERALREIYLTAFEIAVRESHPAAVMCAYNKLNGVHCSDHKGLLTGILRSDWGFDGLVVTDWGAMCDRREAFRAGCDLNMPGGSAYMERAAADAVRSGGLEEAAVNASAERVLRFALRPAPARQAADGEKHHRLARLVAERGAVLLKNEGGILPVPASEVTLIGRMAVEPRYQGSGSSHINPTRLSSLADALPDAPCFPCCDSFGRAGEGQLRQAAAAAKKARVAVVVAGLPENDETEGLDRRDMSMPEGHIRMIEAVAEANPNTVVVLLGGSPMELPWLDKVRAVLYMGLPGQAGGEAAARLLTGQANPSGKLTETWPLRYGDTPARETFGQRNPEYREGVYVGYRYYDKAGVPVRFPFGFGLSYTAFAYSGLRIEGRTVTARVTNTGDTAGAEVVQLYVAPPKDGVHRPEKELKGFARIELAPGESGEVRFQLDGRAFALWDGGWRTPGGTYRVLLGASSAEIRLEGALEVEGEAVPAPEWQAGSWYGTLEGLPSREDWEKAMGHTVQPPLEPGKGGYDMDSTCLEMRDSSLVMKLQYKVTELVVARRHRGGDKTDAAYRMMLANALDTPMRSVVISTGGRVGERLAAALLEMANGRFFRGLVRLLKP